MAPKKGMECRVHHVYVWTCLASLVACVVGAVALGTPSWTEGRYGGYEYVETGILLFCHHRNSRPHDRLCAPLLFGGLDGWFEAVRILSLLCWVFLFTVFVMSLVLHFQDDKHTFSLPLVVLGLLAGAIGIISSIVFAVAWTTTTVLEKYDVDLSWGYAVYVIWHVITIFLFTSVCIAGRDIWVNQFKVQRHHK